MIGAVDQPCSEINNGAAINAFARGITNPSFHARPIFCGDGPLAFERNLNSRIAR